LKHRSILADINGILQHRLHGLTELVDEREQGQAASAPDINGIVDGAAEVESCMGPEAMLHDVLVIRPRTHEHEEAHGRSKTAVLTRLTKEHNAVAGSAMFDPVLEEFLEHLACRKQI
jgi:hypothetical protein